MPREIASIAFEGSQERAAFEALVRDRPEIWGWFDMGEGSAKAYVLPRFRNGRIGRGLAKAEDEIQSFLNAGLRGLRQGRPEEQADEDECFAYRLGFMSVVRPAHDAKFGAPEFGFRPMPSDERH